MATAAMTATATAATCSPMARANGRNLAYLRWANYPSEQARREQMAPAWAGRDRRFYVQAREMHPHASEADIERCVASLKSAWYAELSRRRWAAHPPKSAQQKGGKAA